MTADPMPEGPLRFAEGHEARRDGHVYMRAGAGGDRGEQYPDKEDGRPFPGTSGLETEAPTNSMFAYRGCYEPTGLITNPDAGIPPDALIIVPIAASAFPMAIRWCRPS